MSASGSEESTEHKEERHKKLTDEINAILKEVNEDVDGLSKPPPDKELQKKWYVKRLFVNQPVRKINEEPDRNPAEERDNDWKKNMADETSKILKKIEDVTSSPASNNSEGHKKFRAALTNTIQCINILGKTVAGGASLVSSIPISKNPWKTMLVVSARPLI
jgi:hypothetical protein